MFRLALFLGLLGTVKAGYPTTWPFENESGLSLPSLPEGSPSLTFEDSDAGGYMYTYVITGTHYFDDSTYPKGHSGSGHLQHVLVNYYGAPPVLPFQNWNCTRKEIRFSAGDFTGLAKGETVCAVGECCKEVYGLVMTTADTMAHHTWLDDKMNTGMCSEGISEVQYCLYASGHFYTNCFEYVPNQDERMIAVPCVDNAFRFWMSCVVIKSSSFVMLAGHSEPPTYKDILTAEEDILLQSLIIQPDRVCHPYSYYNPDASSSASSSDGGSTSTSSESSSATSSATRVFLLSSLFALL